MKWEYHVETTDSLNLPVRLNELGKDGWNLVTSNFLPNTMVRPGQYSNVFYLIFKRPIVEQFENGTTGKLQLNG